MSHMGNARSKFRLAGHALRSGISRRNYGNLPESSFCALLFLKLETRFLLMHLLGRPIPSRWPLFLKVTRCTY